MFLSPGANTQYPRALEAPLEGDLGVYPVVALMGARQVGKSTLGRLIADRRGMAYRTLDDLDVLAEAREDPSGLLASLGQDGVFIDEAQRAPELFLAVKAVVDRDNRPGQYLLSGSAQPRVRGGVGDSLVGRATYRTLRPFTLSELRFAEAHLGWSFLFGDDAPGVMAELDRRSEESGALDWREIVGTGGFPRVVGAAPAVRPRLLDDYVRVFATRDIREVLDLASPDQFEGFMRLLAARTGQPLNITGMGTDLQVAPTTLRRWIDALEQSFLIERIPSYSRSPSQRVIKAPKVYMVDAALALAGARETTPTGFHLENLVATDLLVWMGLAPGRAVYHWRAAAGQEVDFVLEEAGQLLPVEVKATTRVGTGDARHLKKFLDTYPSATRALLLSADPTTRLLSPGVFAAPWWSVL